MMTSYKTLEEWNGLGAQAAVTAILPCNGSLAWAEGVVALRPLRGLGELLAASDKVWLGLSKKAWKHAFDSHPRIGEQKAKAATEQSLAWSSGEQSAAQLTDETQAALAVANVEYEQKFGRIFIVCASGKTAAEMLEILRGRLSNDAETELLEAGEQQRQITQIRLRKWLAGGK